jgi:hypothetical protein
MTYSVTVDRAESFGWGRAELLSLAHTLYARARKYENARDSRAVFTHAYALMTRILGESLDDCPFRNPSWIAELAVVFARQYQEALDQYDETGRGPGAWNVNIQRAAVEENDGSGGSSAGDDRAYRPGPSAHVGEGRTR